MSLREVDHLVLGALLHDIGKLMERGERMGRHRNDPAQRPLDCPDGSYHALHSRDFCEWLAKQLPLLAIPDYDPRNATSDHWINLASRHHANGLTPLQRLVKEADSLASGEREHGPYQGGIEQRVRLESILERIDLKETNKPTHTRLPLPLLGLKLTEESLFALPPDRFPVAMEVRRSWKFKTDLLISPKPLTDENRELADGLISALEQLPKWAPGEQGAAFALVRTLLGQLERFLSYVPSATNVVHPDISLFDHLRVTAAIAETAYWQDRSGQNTDEPWRLVCGDFSGIQGFLYRITAKGAAKAVRGRSFFVELLCDGVAEHLLRVCGLHLTCRVYSSGGRFYLLIPACQEATLRNAVQEVNRLLLEQFRGDLFLGLGVTPLKKEHFRQGRMGERWKSLNIALMEDRNRRFQGVMEGNPGFFDPLPLAAGDPTPSCPVCGRSDAGAGLRPPETEGERTLCIPCQRMEQLGQRLTANPPAPSASHLLWTWGKKAAELSGLSRYRGIDLPIPGGCSVHLLDEQAVLPTMDDLQVLHLEGLNLVADAPPQGWALSHGFRFVGRWRQKKTSSNWEFDEFAEEAKGIPRYGVLRMDVDNLGRILVEGLDFPGLSGAEPEMGSLSRWATLSRQLYRFFSGHVLQLLEEHGFDRTQIIYAGGDDLLLMGSWDQLPAAAFTIREKFGEFCSLNPVFTISAGIAMETGKFPFSRLADLAGEALEQAKALEQGGKEQAKNAFTFLETPVGWEDLAKVEKLRQAIQATVTRSGGNRGIIARLSDTVVAQQERRNRLREFLRLGRISRDRMGEMLFYDRWRWQLIYSLTRFGKDHSDSADLLQEIQRTLLEHDPKLRHPVLDWLALPVRWADFLTRKES